MLYCIACKHDSIEITANMLYFSTVQIQDFKAQQFFLKRFTVQSRNENGFIKSVGNNRIQLAFLADHLLARNFYG